MFADDTSASLKAPTFDALKEKLMEVAKSITSWFQIHKLDKFVPNFDKTEFIIYGRSNQKLKNLSLNKITIDNNHKIKRVYTANYLGIVFDPTINFKNTYFVVETKIIKKYRYAPPNKIFYSHIRF